MENVHDWCISRQLWWGHRIPAFYCDSCGEMTVSKEVLTTCPKCGGTVRQDEDVLDTWFSSALWPFPHWMARQNPNDGLFFPTNVLVTVMILYFSGGKKIFQA
jgi:valyl-tRNA synthetase